MAYSISQRRRLMDYNRLLLRNNINKYIRCK